MIDENYLTKEQVKALKRKYKFNTWPFFYPEIMLAPYWNDRRKKWGTFIVVGSKNTGKTTNIIRYALKRAIANRFEGAGRFVLVRRTGKERIAYWHAGANQGKWWPNCVCRKDLIYWVDPDTKEEFLVAKLESISGSGIGRGIENTGFDTVIFDDFIGLQGERRISGFSERLIPLVSNYLRTNLENGKGLLILIGNNDRLDAEWLIENNYQIPEAGGVVELVDDNQGGGAVMYVEGINTKHGIISTQLKGFKHTPLSWASQMSIDYLYSNQCMVTDENIIDLRKWFWPEKRKPPYQFVADNRYIFIEQGEYWYTNSTKGIPRSDTIQKMWICHVVDRKQVDFKRPIYALHILDKIKALGKVTTLSETLGSWLWELFNRGQLGFTNPVIKEKLIKSCQKWTSRNYILGHEPWRR